MQTSSSLRPYTISPYALDCLRRLPANAKPRDIAQAIGVLAVALGVLVVLDYINKG